MIWLIFHLSSQSTSILCQGHTHTHTHTHLLSIMERVKGMILRNSSLLVFLLHPSSIETTFSNAALLQQVSKPSYTMNWLKIHKTYFYKSCIISMSFFTFIIILLSYLSTRMPKISQILETLHITMDSTYSLFNGIWDLSPLISTPFGATIF